MKTDRLIDTNLLIRFLTGDDPKKAEAVEKLLKSGKPLFIPDLVFAEIVWVLQSFYEVPREIIYARLKSVVGFKNIDCDKILLTQSLENFINNPHLSFVDCYLTALIQTGKGKILYSFDRGFDNLLKDKRLEP